MLNTSFTKTPIYRVILVLLAAFLLVSTGRAEEKPKDAIYWNLRLAKTINIPGTFSFRKRLWMLTEDHLGKIKDAGFTAVRIPVGWQWQIESDPPHGIDPAFLAEVDQGLRWGLDKGLVMVLDFHAGLQFGDFSDESSKPMFLAIWRQLAEHYHDWPEALLFEILNEPRGMSMKDWNTWQNEAVAIIRETNPGRTLVVGSIQYNKAEYLATLKLPEQDRNLIATWHLYVPYEFAQQGTILRKTGRPRPTGVTFGSEKDRKQIDEKVALAVQYTRQTGRPTWCGEMGVTNFAGRSDAMRWIRYCRNRLEQNGITWGYWEFIGDDFGLFDPRTGQWDTEKLDALGL